jgi:hypothetical protein
MDRAWIMDFLRDALFGITAGILMGITEVAVSKKEKRKDGHIEPTDKKEEKGNKKD